MFKKRRVYLDWAAATPLCKEAYVAMRKVLKEIYGNPSAVHTEGQKARKAVEDARVLVARTAQVKPEYVTFTSGGTESNNVAIVGLIEHLHQAGRAYNSMNIITTRIEHPSVINTFSALQKRGVLIDFVSVDSVGRVDSTHLRSLITENTVLLSVAYINSEIGTIQPLHQLRTIIATAEKNFETEIFLHVDAAQAPLWLSCQFDSLGADLMSLDFAKCGGPKGIGALLRSRRVMVSPVLQGGGQESGLRSGTENVFGIVGGAAAFAAAQQNYKTRSNAVTNVRDTAIATIEEVIQGVILNGAEGDSRVANNINISILGIDTEYLAVWLDNKGFAVSTKSACAGAGGGESTVVKEISSDPARASSTLRITLGPDTTGKQLTTLAKEIRTHITLMSKLTQK